MKRIAQIVLICLMIAGIIVIAVKGFNVGLEYSESTKISVNIGKEFDVGEMKILVKEVFTNQEVIIQQVELYKDMVQITVKDSNDEQIESLNNKLNEKYEIENKVSDIVIAKSANTKLRTLVKPYVAPIIISAAIIVIYLLIRFRKVKLFKKLYSMIVSIVAPQAILFSLYAITRLPINKYTALISISLYFISIVVLYTKLSKANDEKIKEKE